ncbi:striated muscle-specific serine/threonine-protein kinase-like [Acanthaster planci]|uniref:Striated muscle-specific serine/threonine-protein kinase-like n=1 Tax=Acanthaster planci TaxID=133434 RepID=A0A8B7Z8K1_ACAPL|nr:striated muscle-specific serine/threonine-protein kinase-like [Acanthaster planci]
MSFFSAGHLLETIEESSDSDLDSNGFDTASEGEEAPEFTQQLVDQTTREGESVIFVCTITGHPKPDVNWFRNKSAIGKHEDFTIAVSRDRYSLQISPAYPEDTGIYTAQASNSSWVRCSQARLTVKEFFTDSDELNGLCFGNDLQQADGSSEDEDSSADVDPETEAAARLGNNKGQGRRSGMMAKMLKKRIRLKPGDTALLECFLDPSKANVKVKWLKEDEEIIPELSQRYKVRHDDSGVHSLEISDIISDDEGEYSCVASCEDSTTSNTTQLIMKERKPKPWDPVPARFLNRIEDLIVTEGEEALFRCQIVGHPVPEVTWYQDDEQLFPCQDVKMTFDGRTTFMIIAAAYPEDSGQYTCQIYNGLGGRLTCSANLKVKKIKSKKLVPKPPEFTEVFHDRTVSEGTEVKFECRIRGNPKPKVVWLFNNRELKQSPDFLFFRKHNLYVLHIVEAFPEDEGEYTCKAFNSVGETQWSAELFVEEQQSIIPSPAIGPHAANFFRPSFISHTKDCKAVEGGPATFNCKVTGSPEPEVVWLFNQLQIAENDHYILEHGDDGSCMLIIPHVTPKDVGEYTCTARSSLGVAQSISNLEVTERISDDDQEPDSGYRGQDISDDYRCSSSGSTDVPCRPVGKPNVSKIAGESILLTWEPVPNNDSDSTVMYIIEGKDANEEDWVLIATDVTDASYWVSSVNAEGTYVFRVRAEGENGISEPSEESDVVCLMDLLSKIQDTSASPSKCCLKKQNSISIAKDIKPFFMEGQEDVYVLEHSTAVLSCKVLCEPPPVVKWYRDEDIVDNKKMQASYKEDGTCLLEIKDVTYKDIGEYECVAENKTGKASCRLYLDVAEPPDIIKGFPDTSAPAGEQLRLDVRVGGIPEPDVIWYKDERPLSPTSKFTFLFEGEDMCSLKIDQAVPDDEGFYKMTAINMAGEVSHSARVTVPDPMKFFFSDSRIKIKKDVTVEDEYEVLAELGKGAYGIVKKCIHKETKKECAVKIIRVKNGMWDDLRREVLVMGMLDHKRLVSIYDSYETKQDVIMVMELVSGGELFERIVSRDHITESETVFFIKQVIEGVHHMHEKNIVHLDLKPENILLVSPDSDDLKVIDFGLARVVSPDRDVICKFGTPEFVAPEVVCKQPVSTASDVWSIGVMAYILLSGMSPFMGDDDKQTLMKVKRGYWDFDDEVWDSISDEAKEFLKAVLVLDPKKRLSLDQCLQHSWLKFDERHDQGVAKLSTQRLKTFNSRRKWQKALTAVKSAMRLRRLSSIAASDINAFRQRHLQGKSHGQSTDSQNKDDKTPQADGEGRDDTQGETGMGYGFMVCTEEDEAAGILPLPCIIDDSMGTDDDENPACLVVPSLMAQSFVGHPLHVTSTQSTSCVGLSTETTESPPVFSIHLQEVITTGGNDLQLTCNVKGHPLPTFTWLHNDKELVGGKRIQLTSDGKGQGSLVIMRVEDEEAGMYKCIATNKQGSATSCAKVTIFEKPDAPLRPKVSLAAATEVVVTWNFPSTRVTITGFRLQSKKEDDKQWNIVEDKIQQCFKHISPLLPSTEYRFRVACCTQYGIGPYSRSSVPTTTLPIGSQPLSIEAIAKFQTLSRSCSLDQDHKSSSREVILENFPDGGIEQTIDLTLKESLPQKAYDFNIEIGRGRYAVVRKCYKYSTGLEYAAKIMLSAEPVNKQNLLEYEILKELNHPNIVQLRDAFLTKRFYVLVMERYYGGGVMSHLIQKDKYTEQQIVRLVRQLLSVLSFLHQRNIVHLDMRHDNIVLESRRRDALRVIDFGSARRMESDDGMKMEGLDSPPEFMAPEIASDGLIEYETDLWALGVMIFVWLSGTSPFLGRNREKTIYNITRLKVNRKHLFKNCTAEAKQFIWAILQKEPIDRPSVDECLASPWLSDTPEMKAKREAAVFSSRKLRTQRTEYKFRLLAQQTRADMSLRRYSSTIELKSPGATVSPKPKNGVLNSLVYPKVQT